MTAESEPESDPIGIALRVARALTAVGADYFLGGSLASSLQGEPRSTNDIDFVIALTLDKVSALRDELGPDFELDTDKLREALRHATCASGFYLPSVTKIDFFGCGQEPFDESEFSRRRLVAVNAAGDELFVKTPEDTVLRKLLWYRQGGEVSDKQWRDVVSVLRVSGPLLHVEYLDRWAAKLGLTNLLERARRSVT